MGMDISLFEMLDGKQSSVELVHQYRMNKEIMNLANKLTYSGKLQCMSDSTANSFIEINKQFIESIKLEKIKKLFLEPMIFIDVTELLSLNESTENQMTNQIECEIVSYICNLYKKYSECKSEDIGIIAPYNNQVKAIQTMFAHKSFFQE